MTPAARKFVFSRGLPKTDQVTSYQAGDDGDYEAGWNMGQRFVESVVGGENLILDRATGLQWGKDWTDGGGYDGNMVTWNNAVTVAEGSAWAGLTDWRLPNLKELSSLMVQDAANFIATGVLIDPLFINVVSSYWTSTTDATNIANAFYVSFQVGSMGGIAKTVEILMAIVRGGL